MDLRFDCKILLALALLIVAPGFSLANPCQPQPASQADQKLTECMKLVEQGFVQAAFEQAKQTKQVHGHERLFTVSYVNTLVSMAGKKESGIEVEIINEAIAAVNAARSTKMYDGNNDAEIAFHFMNSLGRLSEALDSISVSNASLLRVYQGQIATRLQGNLSYPKNALEALAKPMIEMAKGYAEQKEVALAYQAIETAIKCGHADYRKLGEEVWFQNLVDAETAKGWMAKFDVSYANAVDLWSRQVVREFQGANFEFSLDDIEGSTVSKTDYAGKILIVDLWATWCPPCCKGVPDFIELQKNYKRDGVAVLGISMDAPDDPSNILEAVCDFVEEKNINYDIALGDATISSQLVGEMALPTTLFIGRDGRVRYIAKGYHDFAKIEAITKVLLDESQPISSSGQTSSQNY